VKIDWRFTVFCGENFLNESNAYQYELLLVDDKTLEVYFDGDLSITLSKKR
jgi:hypothetical protein